MLNIDFKDVEAIRYPQKYQFNKPIEVKIKVNVERKVKNQMVLVEVQKTINVIGSSGLNKEGKVIFIGEDMNLNKFCISEKAIIW